MGGGARAWLEIARVSNLPTVWSNALTGVAIGAAAGARPAFPWLHAAGVALGVSLLYVAGMILNDVADADIDARERPNRPIPSGRIRPKRALLLVVVLFATGWTTIALFGPPPTGAAGALIACIVAYDLTHARWRGSVALMGLCRGLVYVVGIGVLLRPEASFRIGVAHVAMVMSITAYTLLLTLAARHEALPDARARGRVIVGMGAVVAGVGALEWSDRYGFASAGMAALFVVWLGRAWWLASGRGGKGPRVPAAAAAMIAGISLVDAYFLSLLARPVPALLAFGCFMLTVAGQRRIPGS